MRGAVSVALYLSFGCAFLARESEITSTYSSCNVYLETACFGIVQGDVLEMHIPVDFVLYDLHLLFGGDIRIYWGFDPQPIDEEAVLLSDLMRSDSGRVRLYSSGDQQYRLQWRKSPEGVTLDLILDGVSGENYSEFNGFLNNFRECFREGESITCSSGRIFKNPLSVERF